MKKIAFLIAICAVSMNVSSQTYKMDQIYKNTLSETYLSCLIPIEQTQDSSRTFSLWGYQLYGESWVSNVYEVEYFKADATDMYDFLSKLVDFTQKYTDQKDEVVAYISGVQVRNSTKAFSQKYIVVFDKERKVGAIFSQKKLDEILKDFASYCQSNNIKYKSDSI